MSLNPDFLSELRKHFAGDIRLDSASRILYSTDASIYQIEPLGVVIPHNQDDLQAVVELAAKYKMPILPRGSGSSLAGQAIGAALIVDCSRWLDHIVEVNAEARTATVESGVILAALNKAAASYGLQFGPDPASAERATLGGVIGNNATGAHSILYGMTADHILSADVVMADGSLATFGEERIESREQRLDDHSLFSTLYSTVVDIRQKYADAIKQNYPKTWRNSAGYRLNYLLPWSPSAPPQWTEDRGRWTVYRRGDTVHGLSSTVNLAPLLAGSEGTLAVIRRATVNLVPKPKHTILAVLEYDTTAAACDDVPRLLEYQPSAIELISRNIVRLAMAVPAYASQAQILAGEAEALLVIEFSGDQPPALKEAALALHPNVLAESAEDQSRIWNIRKMGLGILASHTGDAKTVAFIEDCAIPVERLGEFVRGVQHILDAHHTQAEFYAHASGGCLHVRPILNLKTQIRELRLISEAVLALTISLDGSMSSEHGDGLAHSEWLGKIYGEEVLASFRTLKRAADPDGILNPEKILDAPPMDANLRYGLDYRTKTWPTSLDFSRQDGLANAIEQCNGQGVCRKFDGVMCPSFQATREEEYSTRGRANMLRALISRPWTVDDGRSTVHGPRSDLAEQTFASLDLCLACKGCKSECPSGVDMAKLKFAFMDEYYKSHRRPLRDYLFGYFHVAARWLSSVAPLTNLAMQNSVLKGITARVLGITSQRPFPKFTRERAKVSRIVNPTHAPRQKVIYISDPFSKYVEPKVEQAAFDILNTLGFEIILLPIVSAGAALLSKGFLADARVHAGRVLDALNKIDPESSLPILGIEPPEIYFLKHDYFDLWPERKDEISKRVKNVWLLEEYLIRSDALIGMRVAVIEKGSSNLASLKIKFHPHCHQRAEGPSDDGVASGTSATVELLRACGYQVELTEAGCCGMAGTFGYEAEHYELSMKVGELKLFPAIREWREENREIEIANHQSQIVNQIVSTGAACRMQIEQGAGVEAKHPLELALDALKGLKM